MLVLLLAAPASGARHHLQRTDVRLRAIPHEVKTGSPFQLRVNVSPRQPHRVVLLEEARGHRWKGIDRGRLGRHSRVTFTRRESQPGKYRFRTTAAGSRRIRARRSHAIAVKVLPVGSVMRPPTTAIPPPSLSPTETPGSEPSSPPTEPGSSETVTGEVLPDAETTISAGTYALTVPAGVVSAPTTATVTPLSVSGEDLSGPSALFHINGEWEDGLHTVKVTLPVDPEALEAGSGMAPVAVHYRDDGGVDVYGGEGLSVDSVAETVSFETTSLSEVTSAALPLLWQPDTLIPASSQSIAAKVINQFLGLRAATPDCSPNITHSSLISTTGSAFETDPVLNEPPLKYCVEHASDGSARWKIANNSGTVLTLATNGSARVVGAGPGGDLLSDFAFAERNGTIEGQDVNLTQIDLPPDGVAFVKLPNASTGTIDVHTNATLNLPAFMFRQLGSLIGTEAEAKQLYEALSGCGYPFAVSSWHDMAAILSCAKSALSLSSAPVAKKLAKLAEKSLFIADALVTSGYTLERSLDPLQGGLSYSPDLPAPPGLPGKDGTIVGRGPTSGVLWRLTEGSEGTRRSQPYLAVSDISYTTLDRARAECLSKRYVLRDFVPSSEPLIWSSESGFEAPCPTSAPELALPSDATNWILRTPKGHAWFVDESSELEPIVAGGDYIQCARRYLVLDDVSEQELNSFPTGSAPSASCSPLRIATKGLPGIVAGKPFTGQLTATGGHYPYRWSITQGHLPAGLSVTDSGLVSGTTNEEGVFHVTARVEDNRGESVEKGIVIAVFSGVETNAPWEEVLSYPTNVGAYSRVSCWNELHCLALQDRQVVKTTDGGYKWQTLQLDLPLQLRESGSYGTEIACGSSGRCLVFANGPVPGLLRWSEGEGWSEVAEPPGLRFSDSISCWGAESCVDVAWEGVEEPVVLVTHNAGGSWSVMQLPPQIERGGAVRCNSEQMCIARGARETGEEEWVSVIAVSTDGGASWTTSELPKEVGASEASCDSVGDCVVSTEWWDESSSRYLSGMRVTHDGGITWEASSLPGGVEIVYRLSCQGAQRCWALATGSAGSVLESADGGASWSGVEPVEWLEGMDLSCPGSESCFISGGVRGGGGTLNFSLVFTHDAGQHWHWQEVPLLGRSSVVACTSDEECLVGGGGNVVLETSDGGQSWGITDELNFPETWSGWECISCTGVHGMLSASCPPSGPCWAIFDFGFFYGASPNSLYRLVENQWREVYLPNRVPPEAVHCFNAEHCLVATEAGLLATEDAGASWRDTNAYPAGERGVSLACSDEEHCIVEVGEPDNWRILYTEDEGETWAESPSGPIGGFTCTEETTCWGVGEKLWKSENGGKDWLAMPSPPIDPWQLSCPDAADCWLVGFDESSDEPEVFATHDGGETWLQAGRAALSIDCPSIEQCFSAYGQTIYRKPKD